jgi:hypothetical protein
MKHNETCDNILHKLVDVSEAERRGNENQKGM